MITFISRAFVFVVATCYLASCGYLLSVDSSDDDSFDDDIEYCKLSIEDEDLGFGNDVIGFSLDRYTMTGKGNDGGNYQLDMRLGDTSNDLVEKGNIVDIIVPGPFADHFTKESITFTLIFLDDNNSNLVIYNGRCHRGKTTAIEND